MSADKIPLSLITEKTAYSKNKNHIRPLRLSLFNRVMNRNMNRNSLTETTSQSEPYLHFELNYLAFPPLIASSFQLHSKLFHPCLPYAVYLYPTLILFHYNSYSPQKSLQADVSYHHTVPSVHPLLLFLHQSTSLFHQKL